MFTAKTISSKMFSKNSITFVLLITVAYTIALKSDAVLDNANLDVLGSRLNVKPRLNFEDEHKLFLEELENGTAKGSVKSRQKRYVYLNTETNLDVGYLIVIPVTVVIPSMSNLFNVWRRKRSLDNFSLNITSDEGNPILQSQVDRISSYFDLVNVPEKSCQLRAICEISADPTSYFPLSDIILSKIRDPAVANLQTITNSSTQPTLFNLFTQADDEGVIYGKKKCDSNYSKSCKYSIDKLLNMPVMKFWRKLQSKLRLKFEDDSVQSYW